MRYLRYNTATIVTVGGFYDKADGVTLKTALTITNERISFVVDTNDGSAPTLVLDNVTGATSGTSNDLNYITNCDAALMQLELSAANTSYLGRAFLSITDAANHCPVFHEFTILPQMVYDSLIAGTDVLQSDMTQILGTAVSTPATAGIIDVNIKNIDNDAASASGTVTFPNATLASTTNITAGTIATVTNGVTVTTNNDKTGYALSTAGILAIWHQLTSAIVTASTIGKLIVDNLNATVSSRSTYAGGDTSGTTTLLSRIVGTIASGTHNAQSGDAYARLGAPAGASVSADILTIDNLVDDLESRLGTPSNLGSGATVAANLVDIEAQTDDIGAAGAGLTALATAAELAKVPKSDGTASWNATALAALQNEANDALVANNLDHLVKVAVDTNFATTVHLDSVIGQLVDNGTSATFDRTTESLEAIRDRGDAAWNTATGFATPTNITAGTITTVTNLTNAPTAGDLTAAMKASVNAEVDSALNTAIPGSPVADSVNERIATMDDRILGTLAAGTHNPQGGDTYARLGAPAGASTAADIAAINAKTTNLPASPASTTNITAGTITTATNVTTVNVIAENAISALSLATDAVAEIQSGLATSASIAALNNLSAAQVNAEVVDALNVDTYAEPGQGTPAATLSIVAKINYLYKLLRNRVTQTSTTMSVYNDAGTVVDHKSTVSDDGTTFDKGKVVSGP